MTETMIRLLISTLVTLIASTVKNPKSASARRVRKYVERAHEATGQFLEQVPAE